MTDIATIKSAAPTPKAKQRGLNVHSCACGDTVWAFPWNDEQAAWDAHQRHPLRNYIEEKGLAPPEPRVSHHVIIADALDGDLLRERRWRVYSSKPWMPHRFEVRGGPGNGMPLHQHVMHGEKWVRIINSNGCDVRRANVLVMSYEQIGNAMRLSRLSRRASVRPRVDT